MAYNNETKMYEGYIYKICNTINNRMYVGQTIRKIKYRFQEHIKYSKLANRYNIILYDAINKYGHENFYIEEIEKLEFSNKEELIDNLNIKEIYYIKELNTLAPNGYNISKGGGGRSNSIKKIVDKYTLGGVFVDSYFSYADAMRSVGKDGSHCSPIVDCCNGKFYQSNGYVWRHHNHPFDEFVYTEKIKVPVIQFDINGNMINEFDSLADAARFLNKIDSNGKPMVAAIRFCCEGKICKAYGYVWRHKGDSFDKYPIFSTKKQTVTTVNQYTLDNVFINTYISFAEAQRQTGTRDSGILKCCNKEQKQANGYKWFYAKDIEQPDISRIIFSN